MPEPETRMVGWRYNSEGPVPFHTADIERGQRENDKGREREQREGEGEGLRRSPESSEARCAPIKLSEGRGREREREDTTQLPPRPIKQGLRTLFPFFFFRFIG